MDVTIIDTHGKRGPSWSVDDLSEGTALAAEHGYEVTRVVRDGEDGDVLLVVA